MESELSELGHHLPAVVGVGLLAWRQSMTCEALSSTAAAAAVGLCRGSSNQAVAAALLVELAQQKQVGCGCHLVASTTAQLQLLNRRFLLMQPPCRSMELRAMAAAQLQRHPLQHCLCWLLSLADKRIAPLTSTIFSLPQRRQLQPPLHLQQLRRRHLLYLAVSRSTGRRLVGTAVLAAAVTRLQLGDGLTLLVLVLDH